MATADDLNQAIIDAATKPAQVTADGQSVTRRSPAEIAEAQKALAANEAVKNVRKGRWPFSALRISPPGAGGY